ncbi:WD40 repeat domain-containing protein [Micromonospora auratinigra]|uniref:WD40-like Beta Propeller Repeat n=1 Tax=Micromonospora auratinigra TaxID=261654 RepID=A0A1A8ZGS6_9ACTN|nr:hypothetical protein [Micromonospora auratinigra]SBT43223.1 hypothetical protein GA0070611_2251 [Micromonospora auratinigra]
MQRLPRPVSWIVAAVGAAVLTGAGPLLTPARAAAAPVAGRPATPLCQVRDPRLTELSGLAVTATGFVVVNDGADEESHRRIFFLDRDCRVTRAVRYPSRPRDTEDLALAPDGTSWVADIGDNDRSRQTVGLWRLAPGRARPQLYRLSYPDGPHDAEALLLTPDGRPLLVTKQGGAAGVYAPARDLVPGATVPMVRRGEVRLPGTDTSNPFGFLGRAVVTGGAVAPDGRRVVLRTYADAFEFDVPDGDVVAALTGGTPRVVPLPDEPQGESVGYTPDGRSLVTVSERTDGPAGARPVVLRYPLPDPPPPSPATTAPSRPTGTPAGGAPASGAASRGSDGRPRVPLVVLLIGAALVAVGGLALWRERVARR